MAANPQLVVALEAKLDKFEKGLKDAGVIAEREIAKIEDKFSNSNPQFGSAFAGGALGGLLGAGAVHQLEQIGKQLLEVNSTIAKIAETAAIAGVSTAELQGTLFALMSGGGASRTTATSDLERIATLVSETNRQETALSKILDENKIKYSETLTFAEALPKLARLAADATSVQRLEVSKLLGISRETVDALSSGPDGFKEMEESARSAGAVIDDELIKKAEEFKKEWEKATASITTRFLAFLAEQKSSFLDGVVEATRNDARILQEQVSRLTAFVAEQWQKLKDQIGDDSILPPALFGVGPGTTKPPIVVTPKEGRGITIPSKKESGGGLDSFERELDRLEKSAALQEAETKALGLNAEARARLRAEAALTEAVLKGEIEVTDELIKKWGETVDRIGEAARAHQQATEMLAAFKSFGADLSSGFQAAIFEGKKLNDIVKDIIKNLASRQLNKLFENLASSAFSSFGGPRAGGGPVNPGNTYLVGERGAELFRPNMSGTIVPNAVMGGGGSPPVTLIVHNAPPVESTRQSRGPDGGMNVELVFGQMEQRLAGSIASGRGPIPNAMAGRFGLDPARGNSR